MAVNHNSEVGLGIRKRIPLNTMPGPLFETLCKYLNVEEQPAGYQLFERGDTIEDLFYLLNGEVTLKAGNFNIETIAADSELANFALAHQIPRKIGAVANNAIAFLRIPPQVIQKLQESGSNIDQSSIVVEEGDNEAADDWMTRLLKSPIFQLVPASNLQKTLISLKESEVKAGTVIVEQGDYPGEFYYIVKKGECSLTRKPSENAKEVILGKMIAGDSFGEAAILADRPREFKVTATTDTTLLKLDKDHFLNLIRDPSLTFINPSTILQELENGSLLVDIRSAEEFQEYHIEGSTNTPYFSLSMAVKTLDKSRKVMIICNDGKLSEAAAFDLIRSNFTVAIVDGGLKKSRPKVQRKKANFIIDDQKSEPNKSQTVSDTEISQGLKSADQQGISIDQLKSTDDIDEVLIELEEPKSEPPATDENVIEFNAQNIDNGALNLARAGEQLNLNNQANLLIEAKIQLLKDENRELMKANMQLENQYNELLKQKDMLEVQLQEIQKK
jgi:CRP-like cAMP-binding protein